MQNKPNYYAILPANVRYCKKLKPMEKILYAEITALSNKYGYCIASNNYFAELYEVDKLTISRWISNLKKHNLINVLIDKNKNNLRKIYIKLNVSIDEKINTPIDEKINHNNTSINITRDNNEKQKTTTSTKQVIEDYLNLLEKHKPNSKDSVRRVKVENEIISALRKIDGNRLLELVEKMLNSNNNFLKGKAFNIKYIADNFLELEMQLEETTEDLGWM